MVAPLKHSFLYSLRLLKPFHIICRNSWEFHGESTNFSLFSCFPNRCIWSLGTTFVKINNTRYDLANISNQI
jgi:hypothetical protein